MSGMAALVQHCTFVIPVQDDPQKYIITCISPVTPQILHIPLSYLIYVGDDSLGFVP